MKNIPSAGGFGGKRDHSNMEHWFFTEEIEEAARVRRRRDDTSEVRTAIRELVSGYGGVTRPIDE